MSYYTRKQVSGEFDTVVDATVQALEAEGFGVLADIDVSQAMIEKLGLAEYRNYRILGACNPELANRALDEEIDLGVLLPCNAVVYETDDGVVLSLVDPETVLAVVESDELDPIATDVAERFDRVLERVADGDPFDH